MMTANVGSVDRALRIVAGLAILSLFLVLPGATKWWALVGFVPIVTGPVRWCPGYGIFGISTRRGCCG
jgi:hypothetical protein